MAFNLLLVDIYFIYETNKLYGKLNCQSNTMSRQSPFVTILLLLISIFCWGSVFPVSKLVLDQISNALERQERVEIRGFGSFALHHRPARTGRNPKTGAPVDIPAKHVPHFKPGKEMRERVNAVAEEEAAAAAARSAT